MLRKLWDFFKWLFGGKRIDVPIAPSLAPAVEYVKRPERKALLRRQRMVRLRRDMERATKRSQRLMA